jgi:3-hydroxymyristoyl/3-hydroxydecanoyl-(acyl carrier protein) dehydratase
VTLHTSHLPSQPALLSPADIYQRICVQAPYFALQDLEIADPDGEVTAKIPVQLEPEPEATPIGVAEAGRHLAILGSCAGALAVPATGQHYYLASAARGRWLQDGAAGRHDGFLLGRARTKFTRRRTATAHTLLSTAAGVPLFMLDVDYTVLSAHTFARLFADARRYGVPGDSAGEDPYRTPPPLSDIHRAGDRLVASVAVRPELCRGHFAEYPMLPVAVATSGMTRLAGQLLAQLEDVPDLRWMALRARLRANSLAYAGQTVTFSARRASTLGTEHVFHCDARVGDRLVASIDLTARTL